MKFEITFCFLFNLGDLFFIEQNSKMLKTLFYFHKMSEGSVDDFSILYPSKENEN